MAWKGTAKQRAALKKGQAALKRWRAKQKKNPRGQGPRSKKFKRCKRKVAKTLKKKTKKQLVKRAAGNICAKTIFHGKRKRKRNPPNGYTIKRGVAYFDGAGFTRKENHAVIFQSQAKAKAIGQKIADKLGQQVAVVPNGH